MKIVYFPYIIPVGKIYLNIKPKINFVSILHSQYCHRPEFFLQKKKNGFIFETKNGFLSSIQNLT